MRSKPLSALQILSLCVCMVFGAPSLAAAAGNVTTSVKLPVAGTIDMTDGSQVFLAGMVHVVGQVFEDSLGTLQAGLRINLADVKGPGSDPDATQYVTVGAEQYPPDPCHPPDPCKTRSMSISLISLGSGHPPDPNAPPVLLVTPVLDEGGNLLGDVAGGSVAQITQVRTDPF